MKKQLLLNVAIAAIIAGAVAVSTPVKADPPDWSDHGGHWSHDHGDDDHDWAGEEHHHDHHDHDHDRYEHHDDHHHHGHFTVAEHDREQFRVYFEHHHKICPPGLAKHHHHCVPPGRLYAVGAVIPVGVQYEVLAPTVVAVAPPPPNAVYVQTGGNVYVMDRTTRTILDAVNLANDLSH